LYLEINEEDDDSKVDEGVGSGDQVRLLVNNEDQGGKQARLRRAENRREFNELLTQDRGQ
jgi:hypothetical protein